MAVVNKFNLIDEAWIPVVDVGLVSLNQLFDMDNNYRLLGGNPLQKIALFKLLLAIAHSSYTPVDEHSWAKLGAKGVANKTLHYLQKFHDRFWLHGEIPFLQMPKISIAKQQPIGALLPEVATGNTTLLTQAQAGKKTNDADHALLIVCLMGLSLGGKKTDNSVVLSEGYLKKKNEKGNSATGRPGPSIGVRGLMHNFLIGESILETIWLNLLTLDQIDLLPIYPNGLGVAPWETMPLGESCDIAQHLQKSLMGRLVPLSRFCLLGTNGLHYSEGIYHLGYQEGVVDPSIAVNFSDKKTKVIWVDPEKRPWRFLTALLGFISSASANAFDCYQIRSCLIRARNHVKKIGVWSGGLKVSYNSGEQFFSGSDDFVESLIIVDSKLIGEVWFEQLKQEMEQLEHLSKIVYMSTVNYFKNINCKGDKQARLASNMFWQLCERQFKRLVNACGNVSDISAMRAIFAGCVYKAYDSSCTKSSARQLDAWAKNRPKLFMYLNKTNKGSENA